MDDITLEKIRLHKEARLDGFWKTFLKFKLIKAFQILQDNIIQRQIEIANKKLELQKIKYRIKLMKKNKNTEEDVINKLLED